ncbi:MAG: PepSY-like domain-containing protein [Muribaculaceae bacterium]|nr:PepSY-like domain-containing protein [Muribaculaceae bacterium]
MKLTKPFILLASSVLLLLSACTDRPVAAADLPAPITAFINQHFLGQTIIYADKDLELTGFSYDVMLANGTQLDFGTDHEWDKIDCKMTAVPASVVPPTIATYVQTTFPGNMIVKIDKERYGYDVELANDMELKFNHQGAVIGMDD